MYSYEQWFCWNGSMCCIEWKRPVCIRVKDTFIKYRMASVQQWHTLSWGALLCHSQTRLLYTLNRGGSKPRWNHPEARPQWFTGMFPLATSSLYFIRFDMFPLSVNSLYLIWFHCKLLVVWCQGIAHKFFRTFDTSFGTKMMVKSGAIEIIFKSRESFQSHLLTGPAN